MSIELAYSKLSNQYKELLADNARLREALEKIAYGQYLGMPELCIEHMRVTARAALAETAETGGISE